MLLASHPKAPELAERLLGFKGLFLVGFFLNIGISRLPTLAGFVIAFLLGLAMVFKPAVFFFILTRFNLRARTSMLVAQPDQLQCVRFHYRGQRPDQWLLADYLAVALSITFILTALLNFAVHSIYAHVSTPLKCFETTGRLPVDKPIEGGDAEIASIGMRGVGTSAYDEMRRRYSDVVMG